MADLITSPMGQQMADAASTPNPVQQMQQQTDNAPAPADSSAGSNSDPRPVGTQQDQQQQQLQNDPNAQVPASPKEQAEYVQLVTRFMLYIYDTRKSHANALPPVETVLKGLNNPKMSVPEAVGTTTAQIIFILHNAAKHQGVEYSPDVLFHGADECIVATYLLGLARGIFKGAPPFKGVPKEQDQYPFDKDDLAIIAKAKIFAVQRFGKLLESQGQITDRDRQEAMQFWREQIQHEVQSGKVDDSVIEHMMQNPKVQAAMQGQAQAAPQSPAPQPQPQPQPQAQFPPAPSPAQLGGLSG
jgi:hypothetical protein